MDRLRRCAARARHLAQRMRELWPLSTSGLVAGAACALALLTLGLGEQDLLLVVIPGLGLALILLSLLSVCLAAAIVALALRQTGRGRPLILECGQLGVSGFAVTNLWWLPFVQLRWRWLDERAEVSLRWGGGLLRESVRPTRRGRAEEIRRVVRVEEPFGFARVTLRHTEARALYFRPNVGALRNIHVVRGLAGGDQLSHPEGDPSGDRVDMRRYADGDPIRFVLWKVFARSRRLVVRTPERAFAPVRQTVAYLVSGPGDEAAAGAARLCVEEGALGSDWRLGADGTPGATDDPQQAMDRIVRSADTPLGEEAAGLSPFLGAQRDGSVRRVLIFTPARPGPWLERVARALAEHPTLQAEFVVCTDGVARGEGEATRRRWILRDPDQQHQTRPTSRQELRAVLDALGRTGGRVSLVDRASGEVHAGAALRLDKVG